MNIPTRHIAALMTIMRLILILYAIQLMTGTIRKLSVVKKDERTAVVYLTPTMLRMYMMVIIMLRMNAYLIVDLLMFLKCGNRNTDSVTVAIANLRAMI